MSKSRTVGALLDTDPLDLKKLPRGISSSLRDQSGYVYVLGLSNGMIKVGQTTKPRRRIGQHRADGELHGYEITRAWVSIAHRNVARNEAALITFGESQGVSVGARHEYFKGLDFEATVAHAEGLTYESLDADDGASDLEIRAMHNGAQANLATYMAASSKPELVESAREFHVGMAFSRGFFHDWDNLPEGIAKVSPRDAIDRVRRLSAMTGIPPVRLLDLNWIDAIELAVVAMARSVANELRQHAVENNMHHLVDPGWAFVEWPDGSEQIPCCELFGEGACDHRDEPEPELADDEIDVGLRRLLDGA